MKRFSLKSGDEVWVTIIPAQGEIETKWAIIDGFRSYGICYKNHPIGWHHYNSGLFYGFGYHTDGYAIVCKKKWHLIPAIITEKIRLNLRPNLAIWLHLEK